MTFSKSPSIVPKAIYLCSLFHFYVYPSGEARRVAEQISRGDLSLRRASLRKLTVRVEVARTRPTSGTSPGGGAQSDSSRGNGNGEDDPDDHMELQSAMTTILDINSDRHLGHHLSGPITPAFPNGYGKTTSSANSRWTRNVLPAVLPRAIPIATSLTSTMGSRVVRGLSSTPSPASQPSRAQHPSDPHLSPSSVVSDDHDNVDIPATLSFEDEDSVFTSLPSEIDQERSSELEEEGVDLGYGRHQHYGVIGRESSSVSRHQQPRRATQSSAASSAVPALSLDHGSSAASEGGAGQDHRDFGEGRGRTVGDAGDFSGSGTGGGRAGRGDERLSPSRHSQVNDDNVRIHDGEGGGTRNEEEWDSWKLDGIDDDDEDRVHHLHDNTKHGPGHFSKPLPSSCYSIPSIKETLSGPAAGAGTLTGGGGRAAAVAGTTTTTTTTATDDKHMLHRRSSEGDRLSSSRHGSEPVSSGFLNPSGSSISASGGTSSSGGLSASSSRKKKKKSGAAAAAVKKEDGASEACS